MGVLLKRTNSFLLVALCLHKAFPLSTIAGNRRKVQRVAVVGAGIAGLATAHALVNIPIDDNDSPFEVSIFESRLTLDFSQGAGIQINGGLAVLGKINPLLQKAVMEAGLPVERIQSRTKAWKNPSSSSFDTLLQLNLREIVEKSGEEVASDLIQQDELLWYAITRGGLQQILIDNLPTSVSKNLKYGKKLTGLIEFSGEGGGVSCQFSDGSIEGPFDLIVGADGIKSSVKEYIEKGEIDSINPGSSAAIYSGIRIQYAMQDVVNPTDSVTLKQYFGDGGYALDATYGAGKGKPQRRGGFLVYQDEDYIGPLKKSTAVEIPVGENPEWVAQRDGSMEDSRKKMLRRMTEGNVPDFDVRDTLINANQFFELGVYFHNPFSLAGWSREIPSTNGAFAVLCGDSAHAMPPFLGQGANQAIQDAFVLAEQVSQYNTVLEGKQTNMMEDIAETPTLKKYLLEFERKRWFPTFAITAKSVFLGYLETGGPNGSYAKFRDLFFRVMGIVGVAQKVLIDAAIPKI